MPARTAGRDLNHVAWLYDPLVEKLSFGLEQRFRAKTISYMDLKPGQQILDIGCGTGSLTLMVFERLGEGEVTGIDAAPRMIDIARKKALKKNLPVRFEVDVAENLVFGEESFDVVVNSMFAHHINYGLKRKAFAEMYRVLKPGGLLVTADIDRPTTFTAAAIGWLSRYLLFQPELEENIRGVLTKIMEEAGFAQVSLRDHIHGLISFFTAIKPVENGSNGKG